MLQTATAPASGADSPRDQQFTALLAALCKASSDPLRLQVLRVLREDSFGVGELCAIFGIRQPALSHHLKVLANAGLVATRREGNSIFYRRSELGQRPELEALALTLEEFGRLGRWLRQGRWAERAHHLAEPAGRLLGDCRLLRHVF